MTDFRTSLYHVQGDSGFLLVRSGAVIFRSPALQHFFDCPLQFAAYPDYTNATDTSDDAGLYEIPLQAGDMIVAGTDGLWDNVPQEDILTSLPSSLTHLPQVSGGTNSSMSVMQGAHQASRDVSRTCTPRLGGSADSS